MSHPLLAGYPVSIHIPVQWGEMDAYGHVNNAVFFRYFESARMAYLEQCGLLRSFTDDGIGAILHSTQCRFRLPVYHPDSLEIGARASEIGADRFTMSYAVVSTGHGQLVAEGHAIIVVFDYRGRKKVSLPEQIRREIERLEGSVSAAST